MSTFIKKAGMLLLVAGLGGAAALGLSKLFDSGSAKTFDQKQAQYAKFTSMPTIEGQPAFDFTEVANVATPAVVHIKTIIDRPSASSDGNQEVDPFEFFRDHGFQFDIPSGPREASGSGVIISPDGYICTNNHVIEGATRIEVILNDKRSFLADLVGTDPNTDLALLKIDEKELPFLTFGNSDDVKVGEWVVAVGNPFNLTSTVTAGIVSAKGRQINLPRGENNQYAIDNFIQTDAAVNPGNSGGALVNTSGALIGINAAIASNTGAYQGYSFAIPVNIAKKVLDDLLKYGQVQRGVLGISIQDVDAHLADAKGIRDIKGVYVREVFENSSASAAGLKPGDVILKIDGVDVNSPSALQEQVSKHSPGEKIKIEYSRENKVKEAETVLKSRDGKLKISVADKKESTSVQGAELESITREDKMKLKIQGGVKVNKISSGVFKKAGVPQGFIITSIDKKQVFTVAETKIMLENKKGAVLVEGYTPSGDPEAFALKF